MAGTCCHKCGHVHEKGTSCPKPFLTGAKSCENRKNEEKIKGADGKPCWKGYRYAGTENGKDKCIPVDEVHELNEGEFCPACLADYIIEHWNLLQEAEYQGRKVPLGKPMRGDVKKFKVYVKNKKGNVIKVNFGDPNMKIKKSNPKRRKSFRARHKCHTAKDRTTARYWSCRKW